MPVTYRIFPELDCVCVRFRGRLTVEEQITSFVDYSREPAFRGTQHALLDLEDCSMSDMYFRDMQRLAYKMHGYYEVREHTSRTSIYAPGDVEYGMARMYKSLSEGTPWPVEVFHTRREAMGYLPINQTAPEIADLMAYWTAPTGST